MIVYESDGQLLARRTPKLLPPRSQAQAINSARFKAAGAYAREAAAEPDANAAYEARATGHQNARNIAMRDFLKPPLVSAIDLGGYAGCPGDVIRVRALDDTQVTAVEVAIRTTAGFLLEQGSAQVEGAEGDWFYAAVTPVAGQTTVSVSATARDRAGNRGEHLVWHLVGNRA
ncbi:MAG: hypothetical protein U1G07_04225 [Verrucomicrobiota bacterium]